MIASLRVFRRICWMVCAVLPLGAQADEEPAPRVSLAVTQELSALNERERTTQSMLWARARALSVGVGVEQHSRRLGELPIAGVHGAPLVHTQNVLVGVSLATTRRTSVALQAPLAADARERFDADAPRLALRSRDRLGELRAGLQLKMQMDSQTSLALRPRKGGLNVTLRSQW
jgi:hypothetical protein